MKLVSAYVRPFILDDVRDALTKVGVQGLTAYEVKGFGRQRGQSHIHRGAEYAVKYIPKVKIELLLSDDLVARVVETILQFARTGKTGDGKIYVMNVDQVVRIRTGENDDGAL